MKRNNEAEVTVPELPDDVWIRIFRMIADQRLLRLATVSRNWEKWIVADGLTELTEKNQDFLKHMKQLSKYKSITSARIQSQYLTKALVFKRGLEFFGRLRHVAIHQTVLVKNPFYLNALKRMSNMVSLQLNVIDQDLVPHILPSLTNLRTLFITVYTRRQYTWLSQMTQLETLVVYYAKKCTINLAESLVLDQSIAQLTQLKNLQLFHAISRFTFLDKLTLLERLIVDKISSSMHGQIDIVVVPKLVNLRHLCLHQTDPFLSIKEFENIKQIECLCLPSIPVDIVKLSEKLPKLNHLVLSLEYLYFVSNLRLLVRFMKNCPSRIRFTYMVSNIPPSIVNLDDTYFFLLDFVLVDKTKLIHECSHCRGENESIFFYLNDEVRRVFHY